MFQLALLQDTVHIPASQFAKPLLQAVTDYLNERYPNKVIVDLGMCIALYDVIDVGESILYPGDASQHTSVKFRLVMFKPFVGEILTGKVVTCDEQGARISLGFCDTIYVPHSLLQDPSSWSPDEQLWVWDVTPENQLWLDLDNMVRFRVDDVAYEFPGNTASSMKVAAAAAAVHKAAAISSASGTTAEAAPLPVHPPAMKITAGMDRSGLGAIQWWPDDMGGYEDEDEGEYDAE